MDVKEQAASVPELIQAISAGNREKVQELLEFGADPNIEFETMLPLHRAVSQVSYNKEMTELLLKYGATIHAESAPEHYSLLDSALAYGVDTPQDMHKIRNISKRHELVKLLLDYAIDVNYIPPNGHTALDCAVSCLQNQEITLTLVSAGAQCTLYRKRHPFVAASEVFDSIVVERMLDCCQIDKGAIDNALIAAAGGGQAKTVQLLIARGAQVTNVDPIVKDTALHRAAYRGYSVIIEILLQTGAECNKQNRYGDTPLMELLSDTQLSQETVILCSKILLAYGADCKKLRNNKHQTAYEIARLRGLDLNQGSKIL